MSAPPSLKKSPRPKTAVCATLVLLFAASSCALRAAANSNDAQAAFAQAQQAADSGDLALALADVERGLRAAPRSVPGLNLLGIILARQGENERALQAFKSALEIDPQSVETHDDLGSLYVVLKQPQLAEREFRSALKEAPADRNANYNLGVILLEGGRARDAIDCFRRIQPPDTGTLFGLAQAYLNSGQTEQGLRIVKLLSEHGRDDVRVQFTLGILLASKKQYQAAESELEAADALAPGTFEILYNLGEAYLRDGKNAKAERTLRRAAQIRPDSAETLYLLAQAETAEGNDVDALLQLVRARHLAPQNTDVIFLMARLSMQQAYFEDAIALLDEGLKIAPQQASLHAALGECYLQAGKPSQALQQFQILIKLDPSAPSFAFLGSYYRNVFQYDEAKKCFLLGLALDPDNAVCLYNMGYIANRQGDYAAAESWLQKALAADPSYNDALYALASVKMSERQYAAAIPLLRRCVAVDRHPAAEYYKLMTAERNLHQTQAAERDFKIFQTLSKEPQPESYPFQHVFAYLNKLEGMSLQERKEVDLSRLLQEVKEEPGEPRNYYTLAQTYLQLGQRENAEMAIARLDQLSGGDARTSAGVGELLSRYHLYPEAIRHFEISLEADPASDGVKYALAAAYFRIGEYSRAMSALKQISPAGQKEDSVLALLADTDARTGRTEEAIDLYRDAISRAPDNDQNYVSLALAQMSGGKLDEAGEILNAGLARMPDSGKLFWAMGALSAAEGNPQRAVDYLKRSIGLLPEWSGGYLALGALYFQTGQTQKAREIFSEVSDFGAAPELEKIEHMLSAANGHAPSEAPAMRLSSADRQQFLQLALMLADSNP
jgi:tetratricopeptide (TPR) repeat protein